MSGQIERVDDRATRAAVMLVAGLVVSVLLGGRAIQASTKASDDRRAASEVRTARALAGITAIQTVYGEEAPLALNAVEGHVRATTLTTAARRADETVRPLLESEAVVLRTVGVASRDESKIASDARYEDGPVYDLVARLRDVADRSAEGSVEEDRHEGRLASLLAGAALVSAIPVLLSGIWLSVRKDWLLTAGFACIAIAVACALAGEVVL